MTGKRKGKQPPREVAADEAEGQGERSSRPDEGADRREEEGYTQPESSAQKQPPKP